MYRRSMRLRPQPQAVDDSLPGLCEDCVILETQPTEPGSAEPMAFAEWRKPGWNWYRCGACGKRWQQHFEKEEIGG